MTTRQPLRRANEAGPAAPYTTVPANTVGGAIIFGNETREFVRAAEKDRGSVHVCAAQQPKGRVGHMVIHPGSEKRRVRERYRDAWMHIARLRLAQIRQMGIWSIFRETAGTRILRRYVNEYLKDLR